MYSTANISIVCTVNFVFLLKQLETNFTCLKTMQMRDSAIRTYIFHSFLDIYMRSNVS